VLVRIVAGVAAFVAVIALVHNGLRLLIDFGAITSWSAAWARSAPGSCADFATPDTSTAPITKAWKKIGGYELGVLDPPRLHRPPGSDAVDQSAELIGGPLVVEGERRLAAVDVVQHRVASAAAVPATGF
jgi:hypothetical protein